MVPRHVHFPQELPAPRDQRAHQEVHYPKMAQCKGQRDRDTFDLCWKWACLSAVSWNASREGSKFVSPLEFSDVSPSTSATLKRPIASDSILFVNIAQGAGPLVFNFTNGLAHGNIRPKNVGRSSSVFTVSRRQLQKPTLCLRRSFSFTSRSGSQDSSTSDSSIEGVDDLEA